MFKKLLSTVATTLLVGMVGANIILNTNPSQSILVNQSQTMPLSYVFNNDLSDSIFSLAASPTDIGGKERNVIYTAKFDQMNPADYHFVRHDYKESKIFKMEWGNDNYNYDNVLFNDTRNITIKPHSKISASDTDTVWDNVNSLMRHEETDFLAEATVTFYDGFTYYMENNSYYVQWIVKFAAAAISSFSTVFTDISVGSGFTFS